MSNGATFVSRLFSNAFPVFSGRVWFLYEWIYLFIIMAVIGTRIADLHMKDTEETLREWRLQPGHENDKISENSKNMLLAHKMMFCLGLLFAFVRIIKFLCRFRTMGIFIRLSGMKHLSLIMICRTKLLTTTQLCFNFVRFSATCKLIEQIDLYL